MIRDYIIGVMTLALFFATLSNIELRQKLESKNETLKDCFADARNYTTLAEELCEADNNKQ